MSKPETFVFLLIEDFTHLAFACAIEPLRIANLVAERELYRWRLASEDGARAICSNRSVTLVDQGLEPLQRDERLFVISGLGVRERITRKAVDYLRRNHAHGVQLGAICSGAYALARAGVLDGQACAIHWEFHDAFTEEFPDVVLRRSVFVADAPIVSASGGPAAADLMLHLIAKTHGADLATSVADQMVYNSVRSDHAEQRVSPGARHGFRSEPLKRALREIDNTIEDPVPTAEIARRAGVTPRQLERLFGRYLNCSPQKYYRDVRLHKARNLLSQTDLSVAEIALACGFGSPTHFARCYRQTYGVTPSIHRACAAE
ncbi:MAG: GlxA family transcriptional regulator [Pseudomonadota bacterium]